MHLRQLGLTYSIWGPFTKTKDKIQKPNPIQDGLFWGCYRIAGLEKSQNLPKTFHPYPRIIKRSTVISYLKKI